MNAPLRTRRTGQEGVALLIGLVLLIVLSLTALVAMQLVANQNRIAANAWGSDMGRATAEAALGYSETQLLNGAVLEDFASNTNGAYTFDPFDVPQWGQPAFAWTGSNVLGGGSVFNNSQYPKSTAAVVIEQLPSVAAPGQSLCSSSYGCNGGMLQVFRVTAKAVGPDGKLPVMVQDTSVH